MAAMGAVCPVQSLPPCQAGEERRVIQLVEQPEPVVSSHNEWDPLEEVIVGVIDGACVPPWNVGLKATMPEEHWDFFRIHGGKPFPGELVAAARADLEEFVHILEAEGVTVRRPEAVDYARPFSTPDWESPAGLYGAMPRDLLLVVGDELIEVPMAWRCRYHEIRAYRPLLREYFLRGARWTAAPKPELRDSFFRGDFEEPADPSRVEYVIGEDEPTFDAADFSRCGRDLFVQQSHVTNDLGIQWLQRHLGRDYRIHRLDVHDAHPLHIDATFVPLAPGKLMVNPERIKKLPEMFRRWDVFEGPPSVNPGSLPMCSRWISMNVLSLDEKRVVVERQEEPLIRALKNWGFEPIRCAFRNFNLFGGAFHCATLDVRRRGELLSYF
jgi:glycine amidinotransferase